MMDKHVKWGVLAVCGCACGLMVALTVLVLQGREALAAAERSEDLRLVHDILVQVHKPCRGSGADKADNCGTIALANQDLVVTGDILKLAHANSAKEAELLNQRLPLLLDGVQGAVGRVGGAAEALAGTANAATGTISAARPVLDNAAELVAHLDAETAPMLTNATRLVDNANAVVANPNIPTILSHTSGILATGDHMLVTADKVETKITACTLHPTFVCNAKGSILFGAQVGGYLLR